MATIASRAAKVAIDAAIGAPLSIEGREHNYRCPFCKRKQYVNVGRLHINYDRGVAICHRCLFGSRGLPHLVRAICGSIPRSLMQIRAEDDVVEAVDDILYGDAEKVAGRPTIALPPHFKRLTRTPDDRLGRIILDYLTGTDAAKKQRGVPFEKLHAVGTGYCAGGDMRGYAIFPVVVDGELVTWTSRRGPTALGGSKVRHGAFGSDTASRAVFNYDNCKGKKRIFVGEGPFDAFAFQERLRPTDGGAATLGTKLHPQQQQLLADLNADEIIICYDRDALTKAAAAVRSLASTVTCPVSVMTLPDARDPDELPVDELRAVAKARVAFDEYAEIEALLG